MLVVECLMNVYTIIMYLFYLYLVGLFSLNSNNIPVHIYASLDVQFLIHGMIVLNYQYFPQLDHLHIFYKIYIYIYAYEEATNVKGTESTQKHVLPPLFKKAFLTNFGAIYIHYFQIYLMCLNIERSKFLYIQFIFVLCFYS